MKARNSLRGKSGGFAVIEALLVVIIIAAIVGIGAYVVHQKNNASKTLSSNAPLTSPSTAAAQGTTGSISTLTNQDAQAESSADTASDSQAQSNVSSANATTSSVGGAYNENNL